MKKIYYILPIVLLVMNVLSGCTDSEEEQGPVVSASIVWQVSSAGQL